MSDGCGGAGSPLPAFMLCASSILKFFGQVFTEKLSSSSVVNKWIFHSTQLFLQCVNLYNI